MCLHWRRGDYVRQWPELTRIGLDNLLAHMPKCVRRFHTVLVSTNERDEAILRRVKEAAGASSGGAGEVIFIHEILASHVSLTDHPVFAFNEAIGMVAQLVCSHADVFVATSASSFSGQVNNLRGREPDQRCKIDMSRCLSEACGD